MVLWLYSTDSSIRLEEHIKIHHLRMLLQKFQNHVPMNLQANVANEKGDIYIFINWRLSYSEISLYSKLLKSGLQPSKNEDETTRVSQKPGMMTLAEFKVIISKMLGTPKWNDQMEMLFYKVSELWHRVSSGPRSNVKVEFIRTSANLLG